MFGFYAKKLCLAIIFKKNRRICLLFFWLLPVSLRSVCGVAALQRAGLSVSRVDSVSSACGGEERDFENTIHFQDRLNSATRRAEIRFSELEQASCAEEGRGCLRQPQEENQVTSHSQRPASLTSFGLMLKPSKLAAFAIEASRVFRSLPACIVSFGKDS